MLSCLGADPRAGSDVAGQEDREVRMRRIRPRPIVALLALSLAGPALAQDRPPSSQGLRNGAGCEQAADPKTAAAAPATRTPSQAGATGWHGGTGGSYLGTSNSGQTPDSPTWQPSTARGLDPLAAPVRPARAC